MAAQTSTPFHSWPGLPYRGPPIAAIVEAHGMPHRTTTSPGEATVIVLLCFGWFILVSLDAVSSGFKNPSFTERGVFELVVFEIVVGAFAVYTLKARGFDVGSLYPRPYAWGLVSGALVTVGAGFAGWLVTAPFDYAWYSERLTGS